MTPASPRFDLLTAIPLLKQVLKSRLFQPVLMLVTLFAFTLVAYGLSRMAVPQVQRLEYQSLHRQIIWLFNMGYIPYYAN